jgi:hypothetical protein
VAFRLGVAGGRALRGVVLVPGVELRTPGRVHAVAVADAYLLPNQEADPDPPTGHTTRVVRAPLSPPRLRLGVGADGTVGALRTEARVRGAAGRGGGLPPAGGRRTGGHAGRVGGQRGGDAAPRSRLRAGAVSPRGVPSHPAPAGLGFVATLGMSDKGMQGVWVLVPVAQLGVSIAAERRNAR